ncbi:MAG: hypothetical protein ABSF93_11580 [Candidatus Sulfotelmatobacter sp.]
MSPPDTLSDGMSGAQFELVADMCSPSPLYRCCVSLLGRVPHAIALVAVLHTSPLAL